MSVVIFTKSSIEAAGTLATGPFCYRPFTISPSASWAFLPALLYGPLFQPCYRPSLIHGPCCRPFLLSGPCYRLCTTGALLLAYSTTRPRYRPFLLPASYYQPFLPHGPCYRPFLLPAAYYQSFLPHRLCYRPFLLPDSYYQPFCYVGFATGLLYMSLSLSPATGSSCYWPLTISPFCLRNFATDLIT